MHTLEELLQIAKEHYDNGEYEQAIEYYSLMIEKDKTNPEVFKDRGTAKYGLGRYLDAIADFDRAIDLNPKYAAAFNNRGNAKAYLGFYDDAVSDFSKAIKLDPFDAKAYNGRGIVNDVLGRYNDAISDFNETIKLDPQDLVSYLNRGLSYFRSGLYERSISDCNLVIQLNPKNAQAYYCRALVKHKIKQSLDALKDYTYAIELDEKFLYAYFDRGLLYAYLGKVKEALADFDKAHYLNNNSATPFFGKFFVYWKVLSQLEKSIKCLYRFYYLADIKEVLKGWIEIMNFHQNNKSSPFLIYRIIQHLTYSKVLISWQSLIELTENRCRNLQKYLHFLIDNGRQEQAPLPYHQIEALINFYMEDPIESYRIYDENIVGKLEGISLMSQYYFIRSAMEFIEPHENLLNFAIQDADDYVINFQEGDDEREIYYAGQLYLLREDLKKAYVAFEKAKGFLPAAIMLAVVAEELGKSEGEIEILEVNAQELIETLPEEYQYQNGFPKIYLDIDREDYLTPFLHYANYREILEYIYIIQEPETNFEYLECWDIWQLDKGDEKRIDVLRRKKELEAIQARLEHYFITNLEEHYANYPAEAFTNLEQILERKQKDLRDTFEQLREKAALESEELEHELGLQIDSWDLKYPSTYMLLLRYFYVSGELDAKATFMLYFYYDYVATRNKDYRAPKAGFEEGVKGALEILLSPLPLGALGLKVTATVLSELIKQFFKQKQEFDENDPLSDYQKFKVSFLIYLSEKMETMGESKFLEAYPLESLEDWK